MAEFEHWGMLTELAQQNLSTAADQRNRIVSADVLCRQLRHLSELLEKEKSLQSAGKANELEHFIEKLSEAANACDSYVRALEKGESGTLPVPIDCNELNRFLARLPRRKPRNEPPPRPKLPGATISTRS